MSPWPRDVATRGDALMLLRSLPDDCAAAAFFDPQHRGVLNRLKYGNEGARQRARCALAAMSDGYIDACCREMPRALRPSGYLMYWADTYRVCTGAHLHLADILPCVDMISWDCGRIGMGYRTRRRGDYLLVLQKPRCVRGRLGVIAVFRTGGPRKLIAEFTRTRNQPV